MSLELVIDGKIEILTVLSHKIWQLCTMIFSLQHLGHALLKDNNPKLNSISFKLQYKYIKKIVHFHVEK